MNREILFRGKRLKIEDWVEGSLIVYPDGDCYIARPSDNPCVLDKFNIDPSTVGQYTGLTDKNGKKIFEGDIAEFNDGFDYFKGVVVYEFGAFGVGFGEPMPIPNMCCDNFAQLWQLFWDQEAEYDPKLDYCEVIGTIHDNPELLEG